MTTAVFAHRANLDLMEELFRKWKQDPSSVDEVWRAFFEGFSFALENQPEGVAGLASDDVPGSLVQTRVASLIYAYRDTGHTAARLDPLGIQHPYTERLDLSQFELGEEHLPQKFAIDHYLDGREMTLAEILEGLRETYCRTIGFEYVHMQDRPSRRWIQARIEPCRAQPRLEKEQRHRILRKLLEAETFERFLHTKYAGQKRFSLEGGETLIPCLDSLIEHSARLGLDELVVGMAHRGRLNVLANIMQKSYDFIFEEFSENYIPNTVGGDGDVKYHLGYTTVITTSGGKKLEIRLASNPSHLEAVNPVVEGMARARQRIIEDLDRKRVLPVLIHGDAAFAGQGIVAEVLNYSKLPGYRTGGTVHIIVNNQIGFTTSPDEARSSQYCTDIAKFIAAPIFHVNGDDPEAVVFVTQLALEYRQEFQSDVVIDMYCYRKHGHNETDEPKFTHPVLYDRIAKHPPISDILCRKLIDEGVLSESTAESMRAEYRDKLEKSLQKVAKGGQQSEPGPTRFRDSDAVFQKEYSFVPAPTGVSREILEKVARGLTRIPQGFRVNPKIKRLLEGRWHAFQEAMPIDWSYAEALAFGTLMVEGTPVRLSGQDSERGTFSQRHAALYDLETRERYVPLLHLDSGQARFCVYNSTLSEAGVLGFDFGYSLDYPQMLCLWEAQFGDFVNGAQVIIDQFITTSESKWGRVSGIVLLLPHGYEGQGPEHSSARLERFLQSCAEDNIQVANLTTPAQYFHVLRRQMRRDFRKPLIIMSPKSLLRHKEAVSPWSAFQEDMFQPIIDDTLSPRNVNRLVFCSGKIYYDLLEQRVARGAEDTALIRVEQLYPLDRDHLQKIAKRYGKSKQVVWCQEESQNMGAWSFIAPHLNDHFSKPPLYAGRGASASPAVGSLALHKREQTQLLEEAFTVTG